MDNAREAIAKAVVEDPTLLERLRAATSSGEFAAVLRESGIEISEDETVGIWNSPFAIQLNVQVQIGTVQSCAFCP